jgi:hypothetical protein
MCVILGKVHYIRVRLLTLHYPLYMSRPGDVVPFLHFVVVYGKVHHIYREIISNTRNAMHLTYTITCTRRCVYHGHDHTVGNEKLKIRIKGEVHTSYEYDPTLLRFI